jgi:hypothetical protein
MRRSKTWWVLDLGDFYLKFSYLSISHLPLILDDYSNHSLSRYLSYNTLTMGRV